MPRSSVLKTGGPNFAKNKPMPEQSIALWQPPELEILPANVVAPGEITTYAQQLTSKEKRQITQAFEVEHFEMAVNFVWTKAMAALKRELGTLGMELLGEMINKPGLTEDDDVMEVLTDKESVRLAEELGIVTKTEAMRLRQTHEMVIHFAGLDPSQAESEAAEMDQLEAVRALKTCVKNILGKPKVEVANKFVEFREALISEVLSEDDDRLTMLVHSPYFFQKLAVSILLSVIKSGSGAILENALANVNVVLPATWRSLRDTERWQVGHTYASVYAAGQRTAMSGLKQALLKVKGFDFVPENLRSDTFANAADAVIKAHEGMNNFYNEAAPIKNLERLGSIIPTPAFAACASAILAIKLGNSYGVSFTAGPIAERMLQSFPQDRWQYYLNQCLPGDIRILNKFVSSGPRKQWIGVVARYKLSELMIKNRSVEELVTAAKVKDEEGIEKAQRKLSQAYYGKSPRR